MRGRSGAFRFNADEDRRLLAQVKNNETHRHELERRLTNPPDLGDWDLDISWDLGLLEDIWEGIVVVAEKIAEVAKVIWDKVEQGLRAIVDFLQRAGAFIVNMFEDAAEFLGDFFSGVADAIWNLDFDALVDVFESGFQAIKDAVGFA